MSATPFQYSRREVLLMALSAVAVSAIPGAALCAAVEKEASSDARLSIMLADFAEEIMLLSPTSATTLGLDSGPRFALKSQLNDASPEGRARWAGQVKSMLARMAALDRGTLGPDAQIRYDRVRYAAREGVEGIRFSYAGAAGGFYGQAAPYPVTQQDGALFHIPEFLDSKHQIANAADAEAYLERVAALARLLDQESARIAEQAGQGIMPPNFIAHTALGQLQDYRKKQAAAQKLVTSIAERTKKFGIAGDWESRATQLVNTMVYPALERQIAAFAKATAKAGDAAGVYVLPDGAAYYEWALKQGTTTTRGAREIHLIGLEQNALLQSRIDVLLKAQGMTQGTVGERMLALLKDPERFYADNDQGREQLIAYCNERVATVRALMPKISHLGLKAPLVIKRVPTDIEAGAALGYMNFASLDGSRPAIYYINLKSTTLWPKAELSTLTAHEGIPGHAWQGAYLAERHADLHLPLISSMTHFTAFTEGWALYAEQLVDECGLYAADPFGQIAYLQAQQFRACRLVVDTGLHEMKWTRQQAIRFLVENTGRGVGAMTSEVDRYVVTPGQACSYKMGHNEILRQRQRAQAALGAKFDLAAFNDAVVSSTGVPLTVLPTVIDRYIAGARTV
jgi:uncharacterized protein (DUF885 family)